MGRRFNLLLVFFVCFCDSPRCRLIVFVRLKWMWSGLWVALSLFFAACHSCVGEYYSACEWCNQMIKEKCLFLFIAININSLSERHLATFTLCGYVESIILLQTDFLTYWQTVVDDDWGGERESNEVDKRIYSVIEIAKSMVKWNSWGWTECKTGSSNSYRDRNVVTHISLCL